MFSKGKIIKEPMPAYVGDMWALNDHGSGAGYVTTKHIDSSVDPYCGVVPNSPVFVAALWSHKTLTQLQPAGGYADAKGAGINNSGIVVGESGYQCAFGVATVWRNGKGTDLNTLVSNSSDFTLRYAQAINDSGQIAAVGWSASGQGHTFLLTPCSGTACKTFKGSPDTTVTAKRTSRRAAGAMMTRPGSR